MLNSIGIYNNKYYYNGEEYDIFKISSLAKSFGKKRRIIILSEPIFIKRYNISDKKVNIEEFINKKIVEDFSDRKNLLFHYEFAKESKTIYIYSIRYVNIANLYEGCNYFQVDPIQFEIKKYILKNIKRSKSSIVICKINDLFHLINIENKIIENSITTNDEADIDSFLNKYNNKNKIIIFDENIKYNKGFDKHIHTICIGEKYYEKIFKI